MRYYKVQVAVSLVMQAQQLRIMAQVQPQMDIVQAHLAVKMGEKKVREMGVKKVTEEVNQLQIIMERLKQTEAIVRQPHNPLQPQIIMVRRPRRVTQLQQPLILIIMGPLVKHQVRAMDHQAPHMGPQHRHLQITDHPIMIMIVYLHMAKRKDNLTFTWDMPLINPIIFLHYYLVNLSHC